MAVVDKVLAAVCYCAARLVSCNCVNTSLSYAAGSVSYNGSVMTSTQVVETSVITNNSPSQDFTNPGD